LGKVGPLSGREVQAILTRNGFSAVRRKGSHAVMQKVIPGSTITVVVPEHKVLRPGTLASIIRQSQLPRQAFER
jgi:predicted RNA binding protein YcfA (HicA-like mRNA interferase family)